MRVETIPAPTYRITGDWYELSALVTRLHDEGHLFDCEIKGWTADQHTCCGHIESRSTLCTTPETDVEAAMIRLKLP